MTKEKLKVLIVDDAEVANKRIRNMLKELNNISVVGEAGNSTEAMIITEIMNPDLVLLDIDLPIVNGMDVLREIKIRFKNTSVMIFTNNSSDQYRMRCFDAGADYFYDRTNEFEKMLDALALLAETKNN